METRYKLNSMYFESGSLVLTIIKFSGKEQELQCHSFNGSKKELLEFKYYVKTIKKNQKDFNRFVSKCILKESLVS